MGEYATRISDGEHVKIGTCEDMYYLRADQAELVRATDSSETDPISCAAEIRFRFPFPNEDDIAPGEFEPFKSVGVYVDAADIPVFDHSSVQFTSRVGYIMSIPCPEGPAGAALAATLPYGIHKNGWVGGTARIVQQRAISGQLVLIAACPGCESKYRLETLEMAEPYIVACRSEADNAAHRANIARNRDDSSPFDEKRLDDSTVQFWHAIADRIAAGYTNPPAWVARTAVAS